MLVLSRHENQWVDLTYPGGVIRVLIAQGRGTVKLGIVAPPEVQIVRDDAHDREPRERAVPT